jgi:hypothetical protein
MTMNSAATVNFKGPFFKTDVGRAVRKYINRAISKVSIAAKNEIKAELYPGHGKATGAFRKGIRSKKKGLSSRVFAKDARKAAWLQGTSKLNQRTRFKGYRVFTTAARRTDAGAGNEARKQIAALVRELGGS